MPSLRKRGEFRGAAYDPTPEEIRQACLEIQAGWSPTERRLRHRGICGSRTVYRKAVTR